MLMELVLEAVKFMAGVIEVDMNACRRYCSHLGKFKGKLSYLTYLNDTCQQHALLTCGTIFCWRGILLNPYCNFYCLDAHM
jgi:hypothetical protein